MKAFISSLLGYERGKLTTDGGILGHVTAYYGCVEAQGRGTLHCHMMIWVEGALNPSQLKERLRATEGPAFGQRLIAFLDDTIATTHPPPFNINNQSDAPHEKASKKPLTSRGYNLDGDPNDESIRRFRHDDLRSLVACCQHHKHTETCYKYYKPEDGDKRCRFELEPDNVIPESTVDYDTGELTLRHVDGLVNNYNPTILEAMRCNMDIKFIGTGEDAKAVLYYITDYITKSQLKTHVAYAALALGVERAQDKSTVTSDWTANTKRMLQKCAFSLVANQELSAQQVAQYLQGFDDHFTSHKYANLYWPSFERHIEFLCPSPECEYSTAVELPDDNATGDVEHMPSSDLDFSPDSENIVVDDVQLIDDEAEDDEVVISTDDTGHLVPLSSQLRDYIYRGPALNDINL
ncbi:hypothetical protein C8Q70DRAFT_876178, partial [Cubamyces menziesii]